MSHESELLGHRYTLQKHLGRGAMGAVYQARDRLTHQLVALKRVEVAAQSVGAQATDTWFHSDMVTQKKSPSLSPRVSTNSSITRDVLRLYHLALAHEFRTLSSLRHPHVVSVLDYGFFDGQPYFTMELLRNCQTLREAAQSRTLSQKLELLSQVLLALIYLHRRGVLHRDLKPSNVSVVEKAPAVFPAPSESERNQHRRCRFRSGYVSTLQALKNRASC